ncbi:MAG: hypothetical protein ABIH82_03185, partial [Candidatus Woesearchaeota archaeon]
LFNPFSEKFKTTPILPKQMGMFSKLAFWKKDDLDFDALVGKDMNSGMPQDDLGMPQGMDEKSPFDPEPGMQDPFASAPALPPSNDQEHPLRQLSTNTQQYQSGMPQGPLTKNNDMELLNSKLDTIKAMLNSMDQRLSRIERAQLGDKKGQDLW